AHGGGLAGTVAADEAGHAAGGHIERHAVEHAPCSVALGDVSDLEHLSSSGRGQRYGSHPSAASPFRRTPDGGDPRMRLLLWEGRTGGPAPVRRARSPSGG